MEILKTTKSLCPECMKVISADLIEENGIVKIKKTCSEHREFEDTYWSNACHYKNFLKFKRGGSKVSNPKTKRDKGCPHDCGLCNEHESHTILGIIDVTNRCNMNCPICFANANASGYLYEPTKEQIKEMLENLRNNKPVPSYAVQFSGGEPTIRDDLPELVKISKEMGFLSVMVNTNGIRCVNDIEYMKKLIDAGVGTFYLQFDDVHDESIISLRGRPMAEIRKKFIENCRKLDMKSVCLVVSLTKGVNDFQLGDIINFAVKNHDVVRAINVQPISFSGRASKMEVQKGRITIYDFIGLVEKQTSGKIKKEYFYSIPSIVPVSRFVESWKGEKKPIISPHPCCGAATYIIVNDDGSYTPINEIVNVGRLLNILEKYVEELKEQSQDSFFSKHISNAKKLNIKFDLLVKILKKVHNPQFRNVLGDVLKKGSFDDLSDFHRKVIMIGCMHFMDAWNFDLERVERCVIHYAVPDGRFIPFCSYNTIHREEIERKFSKRKI